MTEKTNSVCKHKTREEAMSCPKYRRLIDIPDLAAEYFHGSEYFEPVAEPAEPSASPQKCGIACVPCGVCCQLPKGHAEMHKWNDHYWNGTQHSFTANPAAPQPVAGEGSRMKKISEGIYSSEMKPHRVDDARIKEILSCGCPEGTPKLEELERQLSICEQNGTKWAHFKVADIRALLSRPFITPACSPPNGKMEISAQEYGNLLAIWQTAVMLFSGLPNELPDVETMRRRMHDSATPVSTVEPCKGD